MEGTFIINKHVTGKNFIGRQSELNAFKNLLGQGENVAIFDTPQSGKRSFIQNAFLSMRAEGKQFSAVDCPLTSARSIREFICALGDSIIRTFGKSQAEYSSIVSDFLSGTHFIFDSARFDGYGEILSLNWDIDDKDLAAVLRLPYQLARSKSVRTIIVLDEFQNVMLTEDGDKICKLMSKTFENLEPELRGLVSYVFVGSQYNAMKDIFSLRKLFYRQVNVLPLGTIESKEIIDHTIRGFLSSGKVVERDLLLGACKLFRCHIGYINQLCFICDSLSKGYIMEPIMIDALDTMLYLNLARFKSTVFDLTTFQVNLLKAIIDGNTKFSSVEVIRNYKLNSSANVRRLKDALCKKEVITFDENDSPRFLDPLFEYWLRKYYFQVNVE